MKTNKKQWIFLIVWLIAFLATVEFLRDQIGLNQIAIIFLIIVVLGHWLLKTKKNPN
jgi:hypothetical protein